MIPMTRSTMVDVLRGRTAPKLHRGLEALKFASRYQDSFYLVGVLSSLYFFSLAPLDPDPHHDGIQFAAASGVAQGLKIHSQVFEQYGPVTAWLQGTTLKIFGPTLLNLRLESAFLLVVASLLMLRILLILKIPVFAAILVCLTWIVSCPVTSILRGNYQYRFWPWSSVLCLVLLLTVSESYLRAKAQNKMLPPIAIFGSGIICAILIFTRIQVGIFATLSDAALLLLGVGPVAKRERLHQTVKFLSAFISTTFLFLLFLFAQGSLSAFVAQVVVGPVNGYVEPFQWRFYEPYYLLGGAPAFILLLFTFLCWRMNRVWLRSLSLVVSTVTMSTTLFLDYWRDHTLPGEADLTRLVFDITGFSFLYASALLSVVIAFVIAARLVQRVLPDIAAFNRYFFTSKDSLKSFFSEKQIGSHVGTPNDAWSRQNTFLALLLLLLPFIVQLYPLADQMHLWWGGPLFMTLIPYCLLRFLSARATNAIIASVLVPSLVALMVLTLTYLHLPRIEITQDAAALKGMKAESRYGASYQQLSNILSPVASNSARFVCPDGLFASWNGNYLSVDARYVDWARGIQVSKNPITPTRTFLCTLTGNPGDFAARNHLELIEPGVPYSFGLYSFGTMFEFAPANR